VIGAIGSGSVTIGSGVAAVGSGVATVGFGVAAVGPGSATIGSGVAAVGVADGGVAVLGAEVADGGGAAAAADGASAGGVAIGGAAVGDVAVAGVAGADGAVGDAGDVAVCQVGVGGLALGAPGAGRRGVVGWARIADSNRLNASLVSPARASAAPATCSLNPAEDPPESLALRAARQIGHHWHSGGSSVGSVVVASSQTSVYALALRPPIVDFTRSVTSLVMLRAPAFISQRWKSPNGSLPGCSLILAA
jgi:hypothetical protein